MSTITNPLFCHDNTKKNYRVSWDTRRAPNTHIPEHILGNIQIKAWTPRPINKPTALAVNKPISLHLKAMQKKEEDEILAEALEEHRFFSKYTEQSPHSAASSPIPPPPPMSHGQIMTFLRELEENPCSSYFICCDKNPPSIEEYLQKTNKAIYHFVEDPVHPYKSAEQALTYFQNRFSEFSPDWTSRYLHSIMQDPSLQIYVPNDSSLSPFEKLSSACKRFPKELIAQAASIFMKTLSALEIAELRVKIDFVNIAEYFTKSQLTVDEIFHSGDILADMKSWIETHTDLLKDKTQFVIPPGTQVIPPLLLRHMPNVTYIKLSHSNFIEFPHKSIKNILNKPNLKHLDLSNNSFTEFPIELLRTAKNLHTLDLSGNPLSQTNKTALTQYCSNRYDQDSLELRPITLII